MGRRRNQRRAPQSAAIIAIANQGRAANSPSLASLMQTNAALYALYPKHGTMDFRDITSGNNGWYRAGPGYDAVTDSAARLSARW